MTEHEYWTLHSPYPDKSWRGIEKCACVDLAQVYEETTGHTILLFDTQEEAQDFIEKRKVDWFVPVRVTLTVPDIRESLRSLHDETSNR